jgi:hypothetical protein
MRFAILTICLDWEVRRSSHDTVLGLHCSSGTVSKIGKRFPVRTGLRSWLQYSRSYYRATYVNTAFDAGFASAMAIRPKWLKDICSVLFSAYYLVWASDGDEVVSRRVPIIEDTDAQLRRFRALCTVEMLRVTWEKTRNPYVSCTTRPC